MTKANKASLIEERADMEGAMKNYLDPYDRFATRMRASIHSSQGRSSTGNHTAEEQEQQKLFVDGYNADDKKKEGENQAHDLRTSMADTKKKSSCCPNMTPFILMIALSVHSIFEGMALGLQSDMASVMNMVIAVCIHKGAASSSLGISLVKTFPNNFKLCR